VNIAQVIAGFFGFDLDTDSFESDVTVATTPLRIVPVDARRVAIHLTNTGNDILVISRNQTVTALTGLMLAPGETLDLYWYNELREIARDWWAISLGLGTTVHIREVIFN